MSLFFSLLLVLSYLSIPLLFSIQTNLKSNIQEIIHSSFILSIGWISSLIFSFYSVQNTINYYYSNKDKKLLKEWHFYSLILCLINMLLVVGVKYMQEFHILHFITLNLLNFNTDIQVLLVGIFLKGNNINLETHLSESEVFKLGNNKNDL